MQFYHDTAIAYLLIKIVVSPLLCILGWVLLGKILSRRLQSYRHWLLPGLIAASLSTGAVLLEGFVSFYDQRDYLLFGVVYLLILAGMPFQIVSFARLWKTISRLPLSAGDSPPTSTAGQDESVWPPQPRRPF